MPAVPMCSASSGARRATSPGVHRVPFDPAQPVATPAGLKMDDATTAAKVWEALDGAVKAIRNSG